MQNTEVLNPDNLPDEFVREEIVQWEKEKNRRARKAEFLDNGDGTCLERFWAVPVGFERIRRITGYLVGDLRRFNDAKASEVRDRVKQL